MWPVLWTVSLADKGKNCTLLNKQPVHKSGSKSQLKCTSHSFFLAVTLQMCTMLCTQSLLGLAVTLATCFLSFYPIYTNLISSSISTLSRLSLLWLMLAYYAKRISMLATFLHRKRPEICLDTTAIMPHYWNSSWLKDLNTGSRNGFI